MHLIKSAKILKTKKVDRFKEFKCIYISRIYGILTKRKYIPDKKNNLDNLSCFFILIIIYWSK